MDVTATLYKPDALCERLKVEVRKNKNGTHIRERNGSKAL